MSPDWSLIVRQESKLVDNFPEASGDTPAPAVWQCLPVNDYVVTWAYRLILGREPENAEVVRDHVQHSHSLPELRERFLESSEFTQRYRRVGPERGRNVSVFPPCPIQVRVDATTRARLFEHVARSWDGLGLAEPYWSVMSEAQYSMQDIAATRDAFLASGGENVERLMATLRRNGVDANPGWDVLELGCGLGRSTRWLAPLFHRIIAADISASHLDLARQLNADASHADRIEWLHVPTPDAITRLPAHDLFFSMIVLQHDPPPVIAFVLDEVARKLRPGGYAFFQLPTYQRGYSFDVDSYLRLCADGNAIEMHAFPQSEIFRIFGEHGCILLEVFEDGLSGHRDDHRSNAFLFHKPPRDDGRLTARADGESRHHGA